MFKIRSKTLSALGSLFLGTTIAVALLSNASAEESTGAKAAESTPAPPIASDDVAPKFFLGYRQLLEEANGQLPVEVGPEFVGISMVPIVSRSRALDEAKANALKSEYKTFVMTYDRMETMTTFVTGPHSVVKFRAIEWVEKTPDKIMTLIVNGNAKPIEHLVAAALVTPEFRVLLPKMRELVRSDRSQSSGGLSLSYAIRAVIAHEGKAAIGDLKKWSKYLQTRDLRIASLRGLIELGELDFVEEVLKGETDRLFKLNLENDLRKARLAD